MPEVNYVQIKLNDADYTQLKEKAEQEDRSLAYLVKSATLSMLHDKED